MRKAGRFLVAFNFSVYLACSSIANQGTLGSAERPEINSESSAIRAWGLMWPGWDDYFTTVIEHLHDEKWEEAQAAADELLWKLADHLPLEQGVPKFLARGLALLSLAEFGAGAEREGAWHWHVAQNLDPDIIELSFDGFGRASQFLDKYLALEARLSFRSCTQRLFMASSQASTPEAIYKPQLRYPKAVGVEYPVHSVRVCVIVTEEGLPVDPIVHLPSAENAIMAFAATEYLRGWRFRPAIQEGVPTEAYFGLKLNFDPN